MTHLNDHALFRWAVYSGQNPGFAKVCVGGESFWIRDVKPTEGDRYTGTIDNELVDPEHGLALDEPVSFIPQVQTEST